VPICRDDEASEDTSSGRARLARWFSWEAPGRHPGAVTHLNERGEVCYPETLNPKPHFPARGPSKQVGDVLKIAGVFFEPNPMWE